MSSDTGDEPQSNRWQAFARELPVLSDRLGDPPPLETMQRGLRYEYARAVWFLALGIGTGVAFDRAIPNRQIDVLGVLLHPIGLLATLAVLFVVPPLKVWGRGYDVHARFGNRWRWLRTSLLYVLLLVFLIFGSRLMAIKLTGVS